MIGHLAVRVVSAAGTDFTITRHPIVHSVGLDGQNGVVHGGGRTSGKIAVSANPEPRDLGGVRGVDGAFESDWLSLGHVVCTQCKVGHRKLGDD